MQEIHIFTKQGLICFKSGLAKLLTKNDYL